MLPLTDALSKLFRGQGRGKKTDRHQRKTRSFRPLLEYLEDRWAPTASTLPVASLPSAAPATGVISGEVFANGQSVTGVTVTLSGTTFGDKAVNVSTQTDASGNYKFLEVQPGTYTLTRGSTDFYLGGQATFGSLGGNAGADAINAISLQAGQIAANNNFSVSYFGADALSLQTFLSTASTNLLTSIIPAGAGVAMADGSAQPNASANFSTGTTTAAQLTGSVQNSSNSEAGIANVQLALTGVDVTGNSVFQTTTTNSSGAFTFSLTEPGTYSVEIVGHVSGFRAVKPIIPTGAASAGGLSLLNSEIFDIVVPAGSTTTYAGYDFQEVAIPAAVPASASPVVTAELADDTTGGPSGTVNDGTTADPSIQGSVVAGTSHSPITSLFAGVNAAATVNVTSALNGGTFYLNEAMLAQIKGVTGGILADGSYTVNLKAVDALGDVSSVATVTFTLQTPVPTAPTLAIDNTSLGSLGPIVNAIGGVILTNTSNATTGTVTLDVTSTATEVVQLFAGNSLTPLTPATNDNNGNTTYTLSLSAGVNNFIARAEDNAGNMAQVSTFIVLNQAPKAASTSAVNTTVAAGTTSSVLNLADGFTNPNGGNTIVKLNTSSGPVYLQMFNTATPQTVANFLAYINSGAYNNAVLNRLAFNTNSSGGNVPFVLQGGNYTLQNNPTSLKLTTPISTINSEQSLTGNTTNQDLAGTLSMALTSPSTGTYNTNSGSDQFFFNLSNNSTASSNNLDPNFTVFAKVLSGSDQRVLNTLAAVPTQNESSYKGDLTNIPLVNYTGSNFPTDATAANFELINSASLVSQPDALTYKVTNISDPSTVLIGATPTVAANGTLTLNYGTSAKGIVTITVSATDLAGASITQTFTVTVGAVNTTTTGTTSATTSFSSSSAQTVTLLGNVSSSGGAINTGTFTFTVPGIGSVTSGTVTGGTASATISVPKGTAPQSFTVTTAYSGGGAFQPSTNSSGTLTVTTASSTTSPTTATAAANDASIQTLTLTGNVSSGGGPVNGGTFTFTVGGLGTVTSGTVTGGTASAQFTLPAETAASQITITTTYTGSTDFATSSDNTGKLTVS